MMGKERNCGSGDEGEEERGRRAGNEVDACQDKVLC
jgi:hypothetical protein